MADTVTLLVFFIPCKFPLVSLLSRLSSQFVLPPRYFPLVQAPKSFVEVCSGMILRI
jgi:hypothetical protein